MDALSITVDAMSTFFKGSRGVKQGTWCVTWLQLGKGPAAVFQVSVKYGDCPFYKGVTL